MKKAPQYVFMWVPGAIFVMAHVSIAKTFAEGKKTSVLKDSFSPWFHTFIPWRSSLLLYSTLFMFYTPFCVRDAQHLQIPYLANTCTLEGVLNVTCDLRNCIIPVVSFQSTKSIVRWNMQFSDTLKIKSWDSLNTVNTSVVLSPVLGRDSGEGIYLPEGIYFNENSPASDKSVIITA